MISNEKCMEVLSLCSTWGDDQSGVAVSCMRKRNHKGMHRSTTTKEIPVLKKTGPPVYNYEDIDIHWNSTDNPPPQGEKE